MRKLSIEVGTGLTVDEIRDMLQSEPSLIGELVAADLDHKGHGDRGEVHDITVVEVEADPNDANEISVSYSYSWSAYYGCSDANAGDDETEEETATYTDGCLVFDVPDQRTTHEEY